MSFRQSGKRYLNTYRIVKAQSAKQCAGIMGKMPFDLNFGLYGKK